MDTVVTTANEIAVITNAARIRIRAFGGTVTMIANVIPLEAPPEGPNYYNLDDSARYRFNIDWNGDGKADRTWTLRTHTTTAYPGTFLYNIGPIHSLTDPNLSVRQTWTLWSQKGNGPSMKVGEGITGGLLPWDQRGWWARVVEGNIMGLAPVVGGSGRIRLDDEVVELRQFDVVRVAPHVVRAFDAGPEGLEILAVGGRKPKDGDGVYDPDRWPAQ